MGSSYRVRRGAYSVRETSKMCTPLNRRKNRLGEVGQDLAVEVFNKYCENGKMGAEALLRFLHEEQGESKATLEDAKHLLEANRKENSIIPKLHSLEMKLEDFISFVVNPKLNGSLNTQVSFSCLTLVDYYMIE